MTATTCGMSRSFLEAEVAFYEGNDPGWYIDDVVLTDLRSGDPFPPADGGYWKHQCLSSPAEMEVLFGTISDSSAAFDECEAIACSVLDPIRPRWQMGPKALRALLALWLNVVTGRLTLTTPIDLPDLTEAATLADAVAGIEATVCDPQAKRSELEEAKDLAEALNSGER